MGLAMSFDSSIAVQCCNLSKRYVLYDRPLDRLLQVIFRNRRQYGKEFVALNDVSFTLPRGQVLGLVGRNGAGKSTLLQIICGTVRPTSGSISVRGRVAALLELGAGFNPEFTGRENLYMNASILGLERSEIDRRFDDIVDFSELGEFINQPVKTYSSGMYVRLAFSIATSVNPDILVIDEALSVGDGSFARKSFDRIMSLKAGGATILFCSHTMYHIEAICDQAIWLDRGAMVMSGTPEKVARLYSESLVLSEATQAPPADNPVSESIKPVVTSSRSMARLTQVSIVVDGVSGVSLQAYAGRSLLEIFVEFEFSTSLPLPSVAVTLETQGGQIITSASTVFDHSPPVVIAPGKGLACLRYPNLPLLRGTYRVGVYLFCERVLHMYEDGSNCAQIEVLDDGLEQGLAFLPHSWNDGPLISTRVSMLSVKETL